MTNELIKAWMTEAGRKLIDTAQIAKRFGFDRCDIASDAQWIDEDSEVRITFTLYCYREPITDAMSLISEDPTMGKVVVKFGAGGAVTTFLAAETVVAWN